MCGRYVLKREDLEALVKQFGVRSLEEWHSRYNIAPTSIVPLIRRTKGPDPKPELAGVRWGLIPSWARPDEPVKPLVNLRAETLVTRFKGALKSRRCVLPASGFFEWETIGGQKRPWLFQAREGGPFGLAGIWDTWHAPDGSALETCTIITTTPNAVLERVHNRMPVILTPEQCRTWVESENPGDVEKFLAPSPAESITACRVGPAVSNVRNDGPECITAATDDPPSAEPQLSLGI